MPVSRRSLTRSVWSKVVHHAVAFTTVKEEEVAVRSVSLRESLKTKRGEKCYVMLFKEELQWLLAKVRPLVESARNKTSTCFVGRMKYSTAANQVSMPGFNLTRACHTSVSS